MVQLYYLKVFTIIMYQKISNQISKYEHCPYNSLKVVTVEKNKI